MDHHNFHQDYDPNVLPQWQRQMPSKTEECFFRLAQRLYEQETNSLLRGSAYKEVNDKLLNNRRQMFLEGANPFMLRYNPAFEPDFCHQDNYEDTIKSFTEMKEELIDPFESINPEQAVSLSWDIDYLAQNPYKALLSWLHAFNKYWDLDEHSFGLLQWQTYCAFHKSTLYLLSIFSHHARTDVMFNPMQILPHLMKSFEAEIEAFCTILEIYKPIELSLFNEGSIGFSDISIYDHVMRIKSVWHTPYDFFEYIEISLRQIFEKHIAKNHIMLVNIDSLGDAVNGIMESIDKSGRAYYLLPYICTKTFAQVFFEDFQKKQMVDSLEDYETLERLFNKHQRKIKNNDIYYADETKHPVIAFMLDVVSFCYEFEMIGRKKLKGKRARYIQSEHNHSEWEVMNQVNTNWLMLYLYGNGRLFNDPCICSHFCELKLPIFLRELFCDEEDKEGQDLLLDISWIYSLAHINNKCDLSSTALTKLYENCVKEFEKMLQLAPTWNEQLAEYIFDPSLWDDNSLKASSPEFQTQIDGINALICEAHALIKQQRKSSDTPSTVVRGIYIDYLFAPIFKDLNYYLNTLGSLHETYGELVVQLKPCLLLMKEHINAIYEQAVQKSKEESCPSSSQNLDKTDPSRFTGLLF